MPEDDEAIRVDRLLDDRGQALERHELIARRVAEALGFLLDREEKTEDAEAKGPAKNLVRFYGPNTPLPANDFTGGVTLVAPYWSAVLHAVPQE